MNLRRLISQARQLNGEAVDDSQAHQVNRAAMLAMLADALDAGGASRAIPEPPTPPPDVARSMVATVCLDHGPAQAWLLAQRWGVEGPPLTADDLAEVNAWREAWEASQAPPEGEDEPCDQPS